MHDSCLILHPSTGLRSPESSMSLTDEKIMTGRIVRSWESNDPRAAEAASEAVKRRDLDAGSPRKTSAEWYEITTRHMLESPRRPATASPRRPPKVWDDDCRSGRLHESDLSPAQVALQTLSSLGVSELAAVLRHLQDQLVDRISEDSEPQAADDAASISSKSGESDQESVERVRPVDQPACPSRVRGRESELLELAQTMAELMWEGEQLVQRLPPEGRWTGGPA